MISGEVWKLFYSSALASIWRGRLSDHLSLYMMIASRSTYLTKSLSYWCAARCVSPPMHAFAAVFDAWNGGLSGSSTSLFASTLPLKHLSETRLLFYEA